MAKSKIVEQSYKLARAQYAAIGVDTDAALKKLRTVPISLHCWQGDDVGGFEKFGTELGGGLAATGNYPGKARTPAELRADAEQAFALIPGKHRFNIHAFYGEFGGKLVDRNEIGPEHFTGWIDWAKQLGIGLDFNPTFFSHPKAASNFTLSNADEGLRQFWVDHGIACRKIAAAMGKALDNTCVTNFWIPDGMKDTPIDRVGPRERLTKSLDAMFKVKVNPAKGKKAYTLDSVEGKLFGIGCESYTVGSHEYYLGYSIAKKTLFTLDTGHYHPTETITDKISSVFQFLPEILLHVSRGVRWDSDHVVVLSNELEEIGQELVRGNFLDRTHIGLDYFDASINRVAAWVIGTRNMLKSLLKAMVEPTPMLRTAENGGDYTTRLALLEECRTLPLGALWDFYCEQQGVPVGAEWLLAVKQYEQGVLAQRK
jgi:L-rhamnose isomerase